MVADACKDEAQWNPTQGSTLMEGFALKYYKRLEITGISDKCTVLQYSSVDHCCKKLTVPAIDIQRI